MNIMKILHPRTDLIDTHDTIKAIEDILFPGQTNRSRPCQGCHKLCPKCQGNNCLCHCSAYCEYVPTALSAEPERYPLEAAIAPLVFELNRLGIIQTVWSCEGHENDAGQIVKLPQVWFYAKSPVHVQLLNVALSELKKQCRLRFAWRVALCTFQQALLPCYTLMPDIASETLIDIRFVRQDCYALAALLYDALYNIANKQRQALLEKRCS